jgi:arylsulfatase A-like enzyme
VRARRPVAATFVVLSGLLAAACTLHDRVRSAAQSLAAPPQRSVCVLFFDGLSTEAFQRLLAEGALPTLKREVVDRGLSFDTAVASIPSETYPNLAAMLTGLFPGHHGIPANIWLDRRLRRREAHTNIFRTYSTGDFLAGYAKTLYERLPADTVAITTPIARGVTVHAKNLVALIASYARNDWSFLDRKTLDDLGDAYAGAAQAGRLPALAWGHLLGPDEVAHSDGPESAAFRATIANIDRSFARFVRRLKRRHIDERILFVLVGDHGNRSYRTYVNAEELVHRALMFHPTEADCGADGCVLVPAKGKPEKSYDVGDAMIAVGAYRGVMIWLPANRPPEELPAAFKTRKKRKPPKRARPASAILMPEPSELATTLARAPEIQLVFTRGPSSGRVEIYGPHGRAEIVREEREDGPSMYAYNVLDGIDPLGYSALTRLGQMQGRFFSADTWLRESAPSEFPDLAVQLPEFFDSPRAPDLLLSPRNGYGFTSGKAAGHGSVSRSETVVPLVFAGPGVAPGHRPVARTVDLAPTLLSYLGVPFDPNEMDGEDLAIATLPVPPPAPFPAAAGPEGGEESR